MLAMRGWLHVSLGHAIIWALVFDICLRDRLLPQVKHRPANTSTSTNTSTDVSSCILPHPYFQTHVPRSSPPFNILTPAQYPHPRFTPEMEYSKANTPSNQTQPRPPPPRLPPSAADLAHPRSAPALPRPRQSKGSRRGKGTPAHPTHHAAPSPSPLPLVETPRPQPPNHIDRAAVPRPTSCRPSAPAPTPTGGTARGAPGGGAAGPCPRLRPRPRPRPGHGGRPAGCPGG